MECPGESNPSLRNHRMSFERLHYVRPHSEPIGTDPYFFAQEAPANDRLRHVGLIALSLVCRSRPGFRRRAFDGNSGLTDVPILPE